ncbi:PMR5 N-terminal domain-containing protein [Cinnamomum micranthum f. kanehirae]|uniref:PMR5 N-terminal domain-containing protein n=1 Tax=Cinnamomum micranthum f. kanehirae TaxID=337451 RepID=A0A3S5WGL6_9MAGN|nr:PMR5 N-terminal domain-containing protein [Cinnamomum micranthum f. kanehirae]
MVKETRFDWKHPWNLPKPNHLFVKIGASILLMCVAFRLFFSPSITFSSVTESPSVERTAAAEMHVPDGALQRETRKGKCDLFTGEWIPNPLGPIYTNESCHVVEEHQNCMKNGRPDSGYLYWRWKPRDCDLPLFDSQRFLENMRNKSWAFVGDSISRNHVQSLLCILSKNVGLIESKEAEVVVILEVLQLFVHYFPNDVVVENQSDSLNAISCMGPGTLGTVGPETMGSCVLITFWPGALWAADTGKLRIGYQSSGYDQSSSIIDQSSSLIDPLSFSGVDLLPMVDIFSVSVTDQQWPTTDHLCISKRPPQL